MNKIHRIVWSALRGAFVVTHENARAHGKPSSTRKGAATLLMAGLLAGSGFVLAAPPVNTLPTNGQIVGGAAAGNIATSGNAMTVTQSQQKMIANWDTFSIGSAASVHFAQPTGGVALNRVNGGQPSEIFGKLSATGAVYLLNSAGIIFGRGAQVDVGALVASTGKMTDADFLAGRLKIAQQGATGTILNEGELKAAMEGYIALLAPEVRNQGVIFAQKGTVVLAAGEAYELQFDGTKLANVRVEPAAFSVLVDNGNAVEAPGGLIILSALAVNRLQGAAIRNNGTLDASSMTIKGGRIVLESSDRIENTGTITASGGSTQAGGSVELIAPVIEQRGTINVSGTTAGSVLLRASEQIVQTAAARIDASGQGSGGLGGTVTLEAATTLTVAGSVDAGSKDATAGTGGEITLASGLDISLNNASLDASGATQGGRISVSAKAATHTSLADPSNPINDPTSPGTPTRVAITSGAVLNTRSSRGRGGQIDITGDHLLLGSGTRLDATGATGGGTVLVGGDWQGSNGVYQATTVTMAQGAVIDVSATQSGNGGKAVLWSDIHKADSHTTVAGEILAKGGSEGGDGGWVETSGKHFTIQDGAQVKAKEWLIDPVNITIDSTLASAIGSALGTGNVTITTNGSNAPSTASGESGTDGDITVASAISWASGSGLTLSAERNIAINANITASGSGKVTLLYGQGAVAAGNTATYNFGLTSTFNAATGNNFTGQINLTSGQRFSTKLGSDGTLIDYTVVTDANSFQAVRLDILGNYALGNNLSLSSIANWVAIGDSTTPFTKKFDGLGHSVSDLTINRPAAFNQGLFGRTNSSASIKNIGVISGSVAGADSTGVLLGLNTGSSIVSDAYAAINVSGANGTGGLVGYNLSGTISNAYATGTATGTGVYTGGFIGQNDGSVSNAYATGNVSGTGSIGGFVGYSPGIISNSYSTGSVLTATSVNAGGFAGNSVGGTISYSYSTGNVNSSANYVGGFAGQAGTISNCYSTGSATSTQSYVGGFVGSAGTISNSYSTGSVSGGVAGRFGGFLGRATATITNSFWDTQTSGQASSLGTGAVGKTTVQMKTLSTFTGAGWTMTGADGAYPTLTFGATPSWYMGNAISLSYTLSTIASGYTYSGTATNLSALWSTADIFAGTTYDNWTLGTDYVFKYSGNTVTSFTNAGTYSGISVGILKSGYVVAGSGNTAGSFTVSQRPINITVDSGQTKTYGAANPTYTYAIEAAGASRGLVNSDTFTGALARAAGEDVGTYAINSVGTLANSNYAITVVPANFAVTQAPLTVTASAQSKTYGDILTMGNTTDTALFTSSGLQNGETIGRLTLASSGAVDTAGVSGSPYTIVPSNATNGTFMASNYSITYVNGALTVNRAPLTIGATGQSKSYGSTLNLGTTGFSPAGLKNTDTIGGVTLSSTGAVDTAARGSYTITPSAATGGTFDSNNYTITYSNGLLTVDRAALTVTATSDSKTYNGVAYSGGNGVTYSGFVLGQSATDLPGALDYSTGSSNGAVNAGSYVIHPSGYTPVNYSYIYVDGALTVGKAPLTITGTAINNRAYTGNNTATFSSYGSLVGATYGSDAPAINTGGTSAIFDTINVANGIGVTATYAVNGTGASNYQVTTPTGLTANITPKILTISSLTASNRAYDGTTDVTVSNWGVVNTGVGSETMVLNHGTASFADPNKANAIVVTAAGYSLANGTNGGVTGNYQLAATTSTTTANITAKTVTLSAAKTYDGSTSLTGFVTLGGFIGSETLTYTGATANSAHVAANGSNFIGAVTLTNGGGGGLASNYQLPTLNNANAAVTISTATLTPTITNTGVSKAYDGAATSTFTPTYSFVGLQGTDTSATLTYSSRLYNTKDVTTANTITVSGLVISALNGNGQATDYVLDATSKTVAGTITPKTLTVAGLAADNKVYDATTGVTISNWGSVTPGVGGETLVLNHGTASFADKTKANGKTVTAIGYSLSNASDASGGLASNYSLTATTSTTTANITAKTITLAGSTGITKTYDGRTSMVVGTNGYGSLAGVEAGDTVNITGAPVYNSANVNAATALLIGTVGIAGTDAGNYTLSWSNGTGATITPAPLTITANANAKFVTQTDASGYTAAGNVAGAGGYNGVSYNGFVNGETTTALGGTLAIARSSTGPDGNTGGVNSLAGTYTNALTPSGVTANNGNYSISYANGNYTIAPAGQLLVTVNNITNNIYGSAPTYTIASAKYLDGSNVIQSLAAPVQSGNTFTYSDGAGGTAVFTLGPQTAQTSTNGALKAGNYTVAATNVSETSNNFSNNLVVVGALTVNQKALTASATGVSKTYDGNTTMTNVSLGLSGLESNDVVTVTGNGNFAGKDAGTNKAYTVSSVTLASADAANYYLTGGNSFSGNDGAIAKKTVSLAATKTYDGNTTLDASMVTISGRIGSETLNYTAATANSKDVVSASYVNALTLQDATDGSGGLAGNYQLPNMTTASAGNSATISRKALTMSGQTAEDKTFNGLVDAVTALGSLSGLVGTETLSTSGTGTFADANVGIGKTVTIVLALANGTNGGLASNYSVTDPTTTATIKPIPNIPQPPPPPGPPSPQEVPTDPGGSSSSSSSSSGGDPTGSSTSSGSSSGGDPTGSSTSSGSSSGGDPTGSSTSSSSSSGGDPTGSSTSSSSSSGGDPTGSSTSSSSSSGGDPTGSSTSSGSSSGGDPTGSSTSSGSSSGGDPTGSSTSSSSSSGGDPTGSSTSSSSSSGGDPTGSSTSSGSSSGGDPTGSSTSSSSSSGGDPTGSSTSSSSSSGGDPTGSSTSSSSSSGGDPTGSSTSSGSSSGGDPTGSSTSSGSSSGGDPTGSSTSSSSSSGGDPTGSSTSSGSSSGGSASSGSSSGSSSGGDPTGSSTSSSSSSGSDPTGSSTSSSSSSGGDPTGSSTSSGSSSGGDPTGSSTSSSSSSGGDPTGSSTSSSSSSGGDPTGSSTSSSSSSGGDPTGSSTSSSSSSGGDPTGSSTSSSSSSGGDPTGSSTSSSSSSGGDPTGSSTSSSSSSGGDPTGSSTSSSSSSGGDPTGSSTSSSSSSGGDPTGSSTSSSSSSGGDPTGSSTSSSSSSGGDPTCSSTSSSSSSGGDPTGSSTSSSSSSGGDPTGSSTSSGSSSGGDPTGSSTSSSSSSGGDPTGSSSSSSSSSGGDPTGSSTSSSSSSGGDPTGSSTSSGSSSGGDTSSSSGSSSGAVDTSSSSSSGGTTKAGSSSGGTPDSPSSPNDPSGVPVQFALISTGESAASKSSGSSSTISGDSGTAGFISVTGFGKLEIPAGSLFSFTLPKDTFKHADPKATVVLEARGEDGPLPDWLTFEPGTGKFSGRPPESLARFAVIIVARDSSGNEASVRIELNFTNKGNS